MPDTAIASLSIGALKSILFVNHVNSRLVLEKSDLVSKVRELVDQERREREGQRLREEAEEKEIAERQREMFEEHERTMKAEKEQTIISDEEERGGEDGIPDVQTSIPPKARATKQERTGLCVICQDEDANIAIVDCGHLAMCRDCSELVMKSSRECPLCRTRIVTEARLLRIFRP